MTSINHMNPLMTSAYQDAVKSISPTKSVTSVENNKGITAPINTGVSKQNDTVDVLKIRDVNIDAPRITTNQPPMPSSTILALHEVR